MTITNRELFYRDPTDTKIPNDGVAKVVRPETDQQWEVLRWELRSFVCDGQYARGLERVFDSFLTNLNQAQQPSVWVSGFYGSGKSHFARVLEHLASIANMQREKHAPVFEREPMCTRRQVEPLRRQFACKRLEFCVTQRAAHDVFGGHGPRLDRDEVQ